MEKSLPSRDTVQTLMVLGIIVLTVLLVTFSVSLLKAFIVPTHGERLAGALIPFLVIPGSIFLAGLLMHIVTYRFISAKYGRTVAEDTVFFVRLKR
jgi:hypothetical protein